MKIVNIKTEYIELQKALKLADLISMGSETKYYLEENKIYVNGEICKQRKKKLYNNDVVQVDNFEPIKISSKV